MMQRKSLDPRTLAVTAVMAAIVFATTMIQLTLTPDGGYIHLGEAGILFSAFTFGPWVGAVVGGVGTALADLTLGFPQWAIFSLIIHGIQGWVAGWVSERVPGLAGLVLAAILGGVIVVAGYLPAGMILEGTGLALFSVPFNALQVFIGGVVSISLFYLVRRAYPPIVRLGRRS
jgi:uncharacterized membrane protein